MSKFTWDECELTFDGIQYNENHQDYTIRIARQGGGTASRKLTCAWGDAINLAQSLRGNTIEIDGVLVYTEAAAHPLIPSLKVADVQITPVGASLGTGLYEQAFLTVAYDVPEFGGGPAGSTDEEDLKEQSLDFTAFNQQIPNEKVQFANGDPVDEDVYTTVRIVEFRTTLYRQASLPIAAISGLINRVNSTTWEGVPAGNALYAGAQADRTITDTGAQEWTVSHVVLVGNQDHRKRWNPEAGEFQEVQFKGAGGGAIIESGNFSSVGI